MTAFIKQTTIDAVMDISIADAVDKLGTPLKQKGGRLWGCCPFHNENTPSFTVTPGKGIYKCFGCGEGGNGTISYYMKRKGLNYPEAIREAANDFGIAVEEDDSQQSQEEMQRQSRLETLFEINERALAAWQKNTIPEEFIRYDIVEEFELAYAPDSWDFLKTELKDVAPGTLHSLGLLSFKQEKNHYYDFWRNRLIFPIRDTRGRLVAFGGQYLSHDKEEQKKAGKYVNSKETELYQKEQVLFGLNQAKGQIRQLGFAYVTEGYWDVGACHHNGHINTVAPCGTSLTEEQVRVLKRYTNHLVLVFDADKPNDKGKRAGEEAMKRAIPMIYENGMTCGIVELPEGQDADDAIRNHLQTQVKEVA